jgi:hypothetical protein
MKEDHLIFMNFEVKKLIVEKDPKKKTLRFECHNLMDPKELEVGIHVRKSNSMILQLFSKVNIL